MNSQSFDLGFIDFRDPWLQDLLWEKLEPFSFYQSDRYNKTDLMKHLEHLSSSGWCYFWGSKDLGLVMRVHTPNKFVLEPHLLGNTHHWRTLQPIALDFAFNGMDIQKINIYTPYPSIRKVMLRYGFKEQGVLPLTYLRPGGQLVDQYILGLSKDEYLQSSSASTSGDRQP